MAETTTYPETVSIEEARKRARENHPDRLNYDRLIAKEIVRTAFGGEIPDTDVDNHIHYELYKNKDRFTDKRVAGVKVHTRRAPVGFKKYYRGTKNRNGEDELDAAAIREKWNLVRNRAETVVEKRREREQQAKEKRLAEQRTLQELSDLRERVGLNNDYSTYFRHNGFAGDLKVDGGEVDLNVRGLTPDQARQMIDLLESFENDS